MIPIRKTSAGVVLRIHVVPRASRCGITGVRDDALKLRITAPPVEGKANEECIHLLAELFDVRKSQVTIIAGHTSRTKTIAVEGRSMAEIAAMLPVT